MAEKPMIAAYSASCTTVHFIPLYSVWKPDTISESASSRSNGARLSSAETAMAKTMNPSGIHARLGANRCCSTISVRFKLPVSTTTPMIESTSGIS